MRYLINLSYFQKIILNLSKQGYLIAIASKNNHDDVIKVFQKHKPKKINRGKNDVVPIPSSENRYQSNEDLSLLDENDINVAVNALHTKFELDKE